jgi:hypothetical protein
MVASCHGACGGNYDMNDFGEADLQGLSGAGSTGMKVGAKVKRVPDAVKMLDIKFRGHCTTSAMRAALAPASVAQDIDNPGGCRMK